MATKPRLSFWQIWNMSFGFLGIQFGFALQNANVSRIFETLGAKVDNIPILWVAAPVTGLLIQPIIGYMSDKTWGRFGRRRPYFLAGAILSSFALFIMPNSPALWIAAGMLWMMDASINISMEPFRAFVGDMLPSEQRTKGFAMQSFFIGLGAVVASALPYIFTNFVGLSNTAPAGVIPESVKWSFYLGGVVFLLSVFWTVFSTKEYNPEELKSFEDGEKVNSATFFAENSLNDRGNGSRNLRIGGITGCIGLIFSLWILFHDLKAELYILSFGLMVFGLIQFAAGLMKRQGNYTNALVVILDDINQMPKTMLQLAIVQFFSWFALFAMWIYTTSAVTHHIYGASDVKSALYNEGADWVGICFAVYNGVAALVAFLLPVIASRTSRKFTHSLALILGGIGLISIFFIQNHILLLLSMIGVGVAWASILSMPYAILAGALPSAKMGTYMGIFNFFIVIPQIIAASLLGFITRNIFAGEAVYALVLGGIVMIISAGMMFFVNDVDEVKL
ncbi:MAG: MFS transporter [Bacteroidales bacterium]|nr:MFS transporter [Bacteroidales bacterium]